MAEYSSFIDGAWVKSGTTRNVRSPFTGEVVSRVALAGESEVEAALASAAKAFEPLRKAPAFRRAELLLALRDGVKARKEEFARSITLEAGKPITDSRIEVDRAVNVLTLSAEESKRIEGEVMGLDLMPTSAGRLGITRRFPVGPVVGITPFNFPLNLGLHKVGPALACGCPIIWKPSPLAPGAAFLFAEIFLDAAKKHEIPAGALNVIAPADELAERLVSDSRPRMVSFTGSARVGWAIRSKAGTKKVALELGGNAAVLIAADADLDHAVQRCIASGFGYSGQTCISAQRILIEEPVYLEFVERLIAGVKGLKMGDPLDESTRVGPMISEKEASRVKEWLAEAVAGGAKLLAGGQAEGQMIAPTVIEGVTPAMNVSCAEVFGPVVTVAPFKAWDDALATANATRYGLQAGVFTRDLGRVLAAFDTLEVGGVIVNDAPSYRMDSMPYGGVKESGAGREGIRYAIEEMTEVRLLVLNN
ncbi:MAG TPA: aldehyde dehydrogenase family protein [Capsulimonadaceae bacterium]|nr:aldehyde dehydrogenase family protein [Capsulimonadaceae bacterium]